MPDRPIAAHAREALMACDELRCISGPMTTDHCEQLITHIETLLRRILREYGEITRTSHADHS